MSVPEEIVVVKSADGKRKKRRKTVEFDGDSDEEAQQLIDEAENEQGNDNDAGPAAGCYGKCPSRTKQFANKCQYTHSYSVRFLHPSDDILINSCTVNVRLVDAAFILRSSRVSSTEQQSQPSRALALEDIRQWNQCQLLLHQRTCVMIRKLIRQEVPDSVNVVTSELCPTSDTQQLNTVLRVYNDVAAAGFLGRTLFELQSSLSDVDASLIRRTLSSLCDAFALLRVGIDVFRYVAISSATCWLVTIDKNIKGRGHRPHDVEHVVNLNTINIQDEKVTRPSAVDGIVSADPEVRSSDSVVQLPQSSVFVAADETRHEEKPSKKLSEKTVTAPTAVKSVKTIKQRKRRSSSGRVLEPRVKRSRFDQKRTTKADWTDSLFVSEPLNVGRDVAGDLLIVDNEELNDERLTVSSVITCTLSVREDRRSEMMSRQIVSPQQTVSLTELPSSIITSVDSDRPGVSRLSAAAEQTSAKRDGIYRSTATDRSQSTTVTSVLKSLPSVQRFPFTDSKLPGSLPSTPVHAMRTTACSQSGLSSTSKATIPFPARTIPKVRLRMKSVKVRPASNIHTVQTDAGGQNANVRGVIGTSSSQQRQTDMSCVTVQSYSSSQQSSRWPRPSLCLDLPSASKSAMFAVTAPLNTGTRLCGSVASGKQLISRSFVPTATQLRSERGMPSTACKPRHHVSTSATPRCLAPAAAMQRPAMPVIDQTTVTRPGVVPAQQSIRIRINAAELGDTADPTAVMNRVRGILSRTNTMVPGAQIRIRYVSPSTTAAQPTTSEPVNTTVSQLDGTADSGDETPAGDQSAHTTSPSSSVGIAYSRRRSKAADNDASDSPISTGTYKAVRLVPRPWKTPEGTVNLVSLKTLLNGVMVHIVENPGITGDSLIQKYSKYLQPVPMFELIEMLETIGCVYCTYVRRSHKPSLFSSRSSVVQVSADGGCETAVYLPMVDCILKLGQFFGQLQSGLRTNL